MVVAADGRSTHLGVRPAGRARAFDVVPGSARTRAPGKTDLGVPSRRHEGGRCRGRSAGGRRGSHFTGIRALACRVYRRDYVVVRRTVVQASIDRVAYSWAGDDRVRAPTDCGPLDMVAGGSGTDIPTETDLRVSRSRYNPGRRRRNRELGSSSSGRAPAAASTGGEKQCHDGSQQAAQGPVDHFGSTSCRANVPHRPGMPGSPDSHESLAHLIVLWLRGGPQAFPAGKAPPGRSSLLLNPALEPPVFHAAEVRGSPSLLNLADLPIRRLVPLFFGFRLLDW